MTDYLKKALDDMSLVKPYILRGLTSIGFFENLKEGPRNYDEIVGKYHDKELTKDTLAYLELLGYVKNASGKISLTELGASLANLPKLAFSESSPITYFDEVTQKVGSVLTGQLDCARNGQEQFWNWLANNPKSQKIYLALQSPVASFNAEQLIDVVSSLPLPEKSIRHWRGERCSCSRSSSERI